MKRLFILVVLMVLGVAAKADPLDAMKCPDAQVLGKGMFTKTCWSGMFPIHMGGIVKVKSNSGNSPPSDYNKSKLCRCSPDYASGKTPVGGFTVGLWQPARLMELTRRPYCFPSILGTQAATSLASAGGERQIGGNIAPVPVTATKYSSFYHFHYFSFPLLAMIKMMDVPSCNVDSYGDMSPLMISEAFPNWYKDLLSALINPEAALFGNPYAMAAMPIDCVKATATNEPSDALFWTAGCWGLMYPFTGSIESNYNPVNNTRLLTAKALSMMTRLGFVRRTVGADAVCKNQPMPVLKKSQYRMQMLFPVAESKGETPPKPAVAPMPASPNPAQPQEIDPGSINTSGNCTGAIGKSTLVTGEWRSIPAVGEDYVYLLWQWVDCCAGLIGGS